MKNLIRFCCSILIILECSFSILAQHGIDHVLSNTQIDIMIDSTSKLVAKYYISEKIGKKTGQYIIEQQRNGKYYNLSYKELGKELTKDLRIISEDIHMSAFYNPKKDKPHETLLSNKLDEYGSISNFGYEEVKILEGNIGYLKIAHFTKWKFFEKAKKAVSYSIGLLKNTDAIIIDVRNNPGGFEDIVAYLVSYFYDSESKDLQEYYCRYLNSRSKISITNELSEKTLSNLPVYILVNKNTGSAAESFAYIMKHLNRATIIGETTAGAGNGSSYYRVSKDFSIQIAVVETINSVTKRSWEKTGVIPHINVESHESFNKAFDLAKIKGKEYRVQLIEKYEKLLNNMDSVINAYTSEVSDELLIKSIIACKDAEVTNEGDINRLGYIYLNQRNQSKIAEAIFKANTIIFPNSSNTYDSYAESLAKNGKLLDAVNNYKKAVELAKVNQNDNLDYYIKNWEKAKELVNDKK